MPIIETGINDWFTTIVEPIANSVTHDLMNEGLLPNDIKDDNLKFAPTTYETIDLNDKNTDKKAFTPSLNMLHIMYDARAKLTTQSLGHKHMRITELPIIADRQGNVFAYMRDNTYTYTLNYTYHTQSKAGAQQWRDLINNNIRNGKQLNQHDLMCNYNIPNRIMLILDEVLYYRQQYDKATWEYKVKEINRINNLPNDDPNKPDKPIHVPEQLPDLTMDEYLSTITSGDLRSRFNPTATLKQPMLIQNYRGVVGQVTTEAIEIQSDDSSHYWFEIEYKLELALPRNVLIQYPLTIYNQVISENLLVSTPTIKKLHGRSLSNNPITRIGLDPNEANETMGDHELPVVIPEFDNEVPLTAPDGYTPLVSYLINIDLNDRKELLNLNETTDALLDLRFLKWLRDGEHTRIGTKGASALYVEVNANGKAIDNICEVDDKLNVRSKIALGPMNTIRVILYACKDIRRLNDFAVKNIWKNPYIWWSFITLWLNSNTISERMSEYLINITPVDLTGKYETNPELLTTLFRGNNPRNDVNLLERAEFSERYDNEHIYRFSEDYGLPYKLSSIKGARWFTTFFVGGCK